MMLRKIVRLLMLVLLASFGVLLAAASSLFCMSWYADPELQRFLTEDDATAVCVLSALAVVCNGIVLGGIALRRRGQRKGTAFYVLIAATLFALGQLALLGTEDRCISLNAMKNGHVLLPVNQAWGR